MRTRGKKHRVSVLQPTAPRQRQNLPSDIAARIVVKRTNHSLPPLAGEGVAQRRKGEEIAQLSRLAAVAAGAVWWAEAHPTLFAVMLHDGYG